MSKVQFVTTRARGAWSAEALYIIFDEVTYGGETYFLKMVSMSGIPPTDTNVWVKIEDVTEPLNAADGLALSIRERTGSGVVSGLEVAAQETEDMTVSVTEGVCYLPDGTRIEIGEEAALTVAATEALKNQKAIVYVSSAGALAAAVAAGMIAVAGAKTFTVATNAVATDTVTIGGVAFTAKASGATGAQFNIGVDAAATAANFATVLGANATVGAKYSAAAVGTAITLTEKVPGGGDTPADATKTGTVAITNGTATTSAAAGTATAPALPTGGVLLAEIAIAAAATTIATENITMKRKMLVSDAVFKTETA